MAFTKSTAASALALSVCCALVSACAHHDPSTLRRDPAVTVVTLRARPLSLTTELPGRVSSYRVAEVRPQVSGVVLRRLFREGDRVEAGQQLYQIDPAPYEAALAQARATLAGARAAVTTAKLNVERDKPLVEARAVSRQDYDNEVATLEEDEANVAAARATVRTAMINLAYTRVYAPISGRTGRSSVTVGALVTADQSSSLVTVTRLDPVYVDVTESTTTLLRLKRELASGEIRSVGRNEAPVRLILDDGSRYGLQGRLEFSEVTVDQSTGSVTLRAIFRNPEEVLLPGLFVRAVIEEGVQEGAILAPQQGISHSPDGSATALVVGPGDKVEARIVQLGRAVGNQWLVTGGLAAGDRLIVGGLQKVRPGMQVLVLNHSRQHAPTSTARLASALALR
ncbi:MAG: efflux RND transporter periplasmic adaptor subunit [Steroidobacteraceae bacterium]